MFFLPSFLQESLTDPSYAHQMLALTYPLVGNYGVPNPAALDEFGLHAGGIESGRVWPAALIVDRICPEGEHSHWQAALSLSEWLRDAGVPGLAGIDVRALTKRIRQHGTMRAKVGHCEGQRQRCMQCMLLIAYCMLHVFMHLPFTVVKLNCWFLFISYKSDQLCKMRTYCVFLSKVMIFVKFFKYLLFLQL